MIKLNKPYSLKALAEKLNVNLANVADPENVIINGISTIQDAMPGDITFLVNSKYHNYINKCRASAVIIQPEYVNDSLIPAALVTKNPRLSLAKLMQLCVDNVEGENKIHPSVQIGLDCNISDNVNIGPNCVIGDRVVIGKVVNIAAGTVIGSDCIISDYSQLRANVTLYNCVKIGKKTIIHSGTVIGSDGFGYANDDFGNWVKMPHIGGVLIGDNVEIGSNVSIDRGFMENTEIKNGVIIDNLVQVGHNAIIGEKTAIAGCVAIAGSANIGASCLIGGRASIAGHIKIADRVHITATSAVNRSLLKAGVYSSGFPARENNLWKKNVARFQFLDDIAKRLKILEKKIVKEEV